MCEKQILASSRNIIQNLAQKVSDEENKNCPEPVEIF